MVTYKLKWVAGAIAYNEDNSLWEAYEKEKNPWNNTCVIWEHGGKSYLVIDFGRLCGGIAEIIGPKPMCINCKHCSEPGVRSDIVCYLTKNNKEYYEVCEEWEVKE